MKEKGVEWVQTGGERLNKSGRERMINSVTTQRISGPATRD